MAKWSHKAQVHTSHTRTTMRLIKGFLGQATKHPYRVAHPFIIPSFLFLSLLLSLCSA